MSEVYILEICEYYEGGSSLLPFKSYQRALLEFNLITKHEKWEHVLKRNYKHVPSSVIDWKTNNKAMQNAFIHKLTLSKEAP